MDTDYLLKRRATIVARHETLESVSGSGWHKDDAQALGEARKGMVPISQRPVAISNDGTFYFCGPCVAAVRAHLSAFVARAKAEREEHLAAAKAAGVDPSERTAQAVQAEQVSAKVTGGDSDVIVLPSNEFNAILYGLREVGVDVVTAGVLP